MDCSTMLPWHNESWTSCLTDILTWQIVTLNSIELSFLFVRQLTSPEAFSTDFLLYSNPIHYWPDIKIIYFYWIQSRWKCFFNPCDTLGASSQIGSAAHLSSQIITAFIDFEASTDTFKLKRIDTLHFWTKTKIHKT